jgi:hypothetical protein
MYRHSASDPPVVPTRCWHLRAARTCGLYSSAQVAGSRGACQRQADIAGRQLLVAKITVGGHAITRAAEHRMSAAPRLPRGLRRYRLKGTGGLLDRSSRPRSSPRRLDERAERAILTARLASSYGPHRLAGLTGRPRSTFPAARTR